MDSIRITGGQELRGSIPISGAKNACLTLMPAALLTDEPLTLTNAPRLSDIRTMTALLESLGCEVALSRYLASRSVRACRSPTGEWTAY